MPTIVPTRNDPEIGWPIGSPFGTTRFANVSFTTTTSSASALVGQRPRTSETPIARRYAGDTIRTATVGGGESGAAGAPPTITGVLYVAPTSPAASTPGVCS